MLDLAALTDEDFARHTGSLFLLPVAPGAPNPPGTPDAEAAAAPPPIPLELVEVIAGHLRPGGARRTFSVVFRGPRGLRLMQRTYRLRHDEMGTIEIFLVPIAPDAQGPLYEAVFN
jgi:hypothetical protein